MDKQQGSIELSVASGTATVTIQNPTSRNSLTLPMRAQLIEAMGQVMAQPDVRAVILTGGGGNFCAGGDIGDMAGVSGLDVRSRLATLQHLVRLIVTGPKPVIAAVEGHAAGAGVSILACCDIVVASRSALFTAGFNRIGLVADLGATWTIPLRMGHGRARYLLLTGRTIDADQAARWGLVEFMVEAGGALTEAERIASDMALRAPLSIEFMKSILARMPADLETILAAERDIQAILFATHDKAEGIAAFAQKRPPRFTGD